MTPFVRAWALITAVGTSPLALAAPPASAPARPLPADSPSLELERLKEKLARDRENALEAYQAADETYSAAESRHRTSRAADRTAAAAKLQQAAGNLVEAAFRAYLYLNVNGRAALRKRLAVTVGLDQSWKSLIEALELRARSSNENPAELRELLDATSERLKLARILALPENRTALRTLLIEIKKRFGTEVVPNDAPFYDFHNAFEMLRRLSNEELAYAAEKASLMSGYDPGKRIVHDRLRVLYVVNGPVDANYLTGFEDVFSSWMREASPDGAIAEFERREWSSEKVNSLRDRAHAILAAKTPGEIMPACPTSAPSSADPPNLDQQRILCPPYYSGIVVVEIRADGPDKGSVMASWRVREEGQITGKGDAFPPGGLGIAPGGGEPAGRLRGNDLAMKVLAKGTLYKRIHAIFAHLAAVDPQLLAKVLADRPPDVAPRPATPPAQAVVTKARGPDRAPPASHSQGASASAPAGTWWHAFAFSGAPYLEDPLARVGSKIVFSGIDLLAVGAVVGLLGRSIDVRNSSSGGTPTSIARANDLKREALFTLGGTLVFRTVTALCYLDNRCRSWTR